MKKTITILLVAAMLFAIIPNVFADSDCFPPCSSGYISIVDALNSIGEDSSYSYRCEIAAANGIKGYHGTAEQNTYMIHLLEEGNLKCPGAVDDTPSYSYSSPVYEYSAPAAPVFVGKAEPVENIIEVTSSCVVRDEPTKFGDKIGRTEVGDCFIVKDVICNKYGNIWLHISFLGEKTAYIYEGNVASHIHDFKKLCGAEMSLCKCGAFCCAESGATTINAAAAAENIFGGLEGLSEAAGMLYGVGTAFLAAASSVAAPVVITVVAVGSLSFIVYLTVSHSGAQVYTDTAELIETESDLLDKLDRDGDEAYYKAATLDGCGLLLSVDGMNIEEANRFLKNALLPSSRLYSELSNSCVASVYTFDPKDALQLGERFTENGASYGFGTSKEANGKCESAHKTCYYDHYHVWFEFVKNWGTHIFFGLPKAAQAA